ncbi:MAG: HPr family phosphocarrier protein [Candidatus Brocadiaceae bacterium]|jgi:phosphotransferase system HPr (HPr) family protein
MSNEHSAEVTIRNRLGFHVRPVQRFAEMARAFEADVQVGLRGREVPGKSVMNLMSLGGRRGDTMAISARGSDARQAVEVLKFLAQNRFFVEDELQSGEQPQRHVERFAHLASCFDSEIRTVVDGKRVDAKDMAALLELNLTPGSRPDLEIEGEDAAQAKATLENLVGHCFYVEEEMVKKGREGG